MLLCPIHHDVIDSDVDSYTVERLHEIKVSHERENAKYHDVGDEDATWLLNNSFLSVSGEAAIQSKNQTGGQTAYQITNFSLTPDLTVQLESDIRMRRAAHDLQIFHSSEQVLCEDILDKGFSTLLADHSYRDSFFVVLVGTCDFFAKARNQYLNNSLSDLAHHFVTSLNELSNFLVVHFFDWPENQEYKDTRFCLHPYLNIDRGGRGIPTDYKEYDDYAEQLWVVVNKASQAYWDYRKAIKEILSWIQV